MSSLSVGSWQSDHSRHYLIDSGQGPAPILLDEAAEPLDDISVEVRQGALQLLWFPITEENRRLE